ncbi:MULTISPECIES: hypothetical protein [unclassified Brevundimonas]|uniref:hypothetical protein n=1 Tax=unclassified Brevundimonas TaxID=2622653 RepID=UPI003F8F5B3E
MKKTLILAGAAALMLSGCGRMADLEAPGATPRQTERAPRDADAPEMPDPATLNRPPSEVPIDNGSPTPFSKPPTPRA